MSPTLAILAADGGRFVACGGCGHRLAAAGTPWKHQACLRERPLSALGSVHGTGNGVLIREFSCPACGKLLDTETAMQGDPFLDDILFPVD